jgi:hypothetical protein
VYSQVTVFENVHPDSPAILEARRSMVSGGVDLVWPADQTCEFFLDPVEELFAFHGLRVLFIF